ncbi:aldehyde:ferredoxin oxidoreductase [Mycoplasmatota bacterium]|nr:aldehyde:ferredoxin oxidoreductase [Mycoplasmatota bacterium]
MKILKEYKYDFTEIIHGYNNRSLKINLSDMKIESKQISEEMKQKFVGGKGFGLRYLWDAVTPETKWNSPENEIVISSGPVGGITQYPGSGKSIVVTLTPLNDTPMDSNVGGHFGPLLKFSGWDALELQGKADKEVIVYIDGNEGIIKIMESNIETIDSHILSEELTEMFAKDETDKRNYSIVSTGSAARYSNVAMLNFTFYDVKRKKVRLKQAGRGGIGRVFNDKGIKALVIKYEGVKSDLNNPANISKINRAGIRFHKEMNRYDDEQNGMRKIGTANIVEVMNDYDLLPTHNFKFGSHKDIAKIESKVFIEKYITQNIYDGCWHGCSMSCAKAADDFKIKTGPYAGHKVIVDGPEYENAAALGSNIGVFCPETILELNFYCDTYGIDTISFGTMVAFAMECYENKVFTKEDTGLDLSFGNIDSALELIHQIADGRGFGKIVGMGIKFMKKYFIENFDADPKFMFDIGMEQKGLEFSEYMPKESLAQQGGYGLTNKGPQHDEAWLIFMDMVNNQIPTFEDKAEALHYFPMFRTWFGLVGLCKLPWNDVTPHSNKYSKEPAKMPEHVQNYVDIYNGVTGKNVKIDDMIEESERVYNFQRIFNIRMGYGKRTNDKIPYRSMGPVTIEEYLSREDRYDKQLKEIVGYNLTNKSTEEKMAVLREYRESQYEKLTDAVYKRRGWSKDGVPTIEKLKELGMDLPELVDIVSRHL